MGLASVILGQGIFGTRTVIIATAAVIFGSVLYRLVITAALQLGLNPSDMKLISAVLVVIALVLPQMTFFKRWNARRKDREARKVQAGVEPGVGTPATVGGRTGEGQ